MAKETITEEKSFYGFTEEQMEKRFESLDFYSEDMHDV